VIGKAKAHRGDADDRGSGKQKIGTTEGTEEHGETENLMIGKSKNLGLFSVTPCLSGEDWVSPIQQLASK
jgi:hypothetical protein